MCGLTGLVCIFCNALHPILEAAKTFAETFTELRKLFAAEKNEDYYCNNDEMCRCK